MDEPSDAAAAYAELFPAVYLRFHRRDDKRSELSAASRAVLQHLAASGPLTVSEMARHLDRAQSVVSDIVDALVSRRWLERARDTRDRRRTLVWLTDEGAEVVVRDRDVLSRQLLGRAIGAMTAAEVEALLEGTRALLRADERATAAPAIPTHALRRPANGKPRHSPSRRKP
jgi:DNA-binding MarR family transcriptional regulator